MRLSILFLLILYVNLFAQISYGGLPKFYNQEIQIDSIEPNRGNLIDRNFSPMVFKQEIPPWFPDS